MRKNSKNRKDVTSQKNNRQKAIVDMAKSLQTVFKKYSLPSRRKAWKELTDKKGQREVAKLLRNPKRALNTFKQLTFKEWLNQDERQE
jgi:cobalamin biosynthesis Co2+ chelatase CbiK